MSFDSENPPHVQFILLAEFDIGKGASLAHQYPYKTGMDEHVLAEMMLPDGVHQRAEDWTIFFLNPNKDYGAHRSPYSEDTSGAHVKAMAICTKHRYLHIYKPVLLLALENYFKKPSVQVLGSLYNAVNCMDVSLMPKFNIFEKMILRASEDREMFEEKFIAMEENAHLVKEIQSQTFIDLSSGLRKEIPATSKNKDRHFFETAVDYENVIIPIRVPLTIFSEEVGDFSMINLINTFANSPVSPHPFHPHLDTHGSNTHPIILLLNALLTEKRIIFLGHGLPSGKVANYVLAACAMGSGCGIVLKGFLERAFPYTSLSDIESLLKFRGFIAGVANPTFEGHPKWWDVLCNISTKKITISPYINKLAGNRRSSTSTNNSNPGSNVISNQNASNLHKQSGEKWDNLDNDFIHDVMQAINSHYGELSIRAKFIDYVQRFVDIAALYEEETLSSGTKIDFQNKLNSRAICNIHIQHQIIKLRNFKFIPDRELEAIYKSFLENIVASDQIIEFLASVPQNQGGLTPVTVALFHPNKTIRNYTVQFLNRIDQHQTGTRFIQNLNLFHKLAYERQCLAYEPNDENFKVLAPYVMDNPKTDLGESVLGG
ncbi:spindle pole body interacting protein [Neoconidiobolus thromboides FSU 785]|nr:spindle pole body interacting protein [Neoconidiobolus thromboides FSU 785]